MKSRNLIKLGVMVLSVAALAACGGNKDSGSKAPSKGSSAAHVCVADKEAGLQSNGTKHWYKCTDATCKKHVEEANHALGEETVTKQANCTDAGEKKATCTVCGYEKVTPIEATGHQFGETVWASRADCTNPGSGEKECTVCHEKEEVTEDALGHQYGETTWSKEANCTEAGAGTRVCGVCGDVDNVTADPLGHDIQLIGDESEAPEGEAKVRVYTCANECGQKYLGFKANEVTEESKKHLTIGEDGGASFWGRPIGNDLQLSEDGTSVNQEVGELVFNEEQTGDFFEYKFTLTQEQADTLKTSRLYCDAKPAGYMGQNNVDFWAYGADSSDWTPGAYIEGEHKGELITDFRYILYVDGERQDLEAGAKTPVRRGDPRAEYVLPYTFKLHSGVNTIRLVMAGGYRSTFYNFTFRAVEEQGGGDAHEHNYVAGAKASNSALRPLACECGENAGYELQAADLTEGQKNPATSGQGNTEKNSRLGKNIFDDVWSIEGIAAGKYALYLNARASSGNATQGYWCSATAVANGGTPSNNGNTPELQADYKYKVKVDDGEFVNIGPVEDNYAATGLGENEPAWTTKALCEVTVAAGAKTLTIHNMNNGYSIWVYGARLVKVAA